ncbi:hypothetical protein [Streptomyces sp. NPDC020983]|uniref:hypothetical protein n=1 Tax=Streptomyces sp. NPDC020983 TaxID=3365106 RepID=UPI0037952CA1
MTEATGGRWLDTGNGPKPLMVAAGHIAQNGERTAYQAYLDHRPGCADCASIESALECPEAARLWDAYRAARTT